MRHREQERYTVLIARTDKQPMVFSVRPIAIWLSAVALMALVGIAFLLGWSQGQASTKKAALEFLLAELPRLPDPQSTHLLGERYV